MMQVGIFSFRGRAARTEFVVGWVVLSLALQAIDLLLLLVSSPIVRLTATCVLALPVFVAGVALVVRRLHDHDQTGWFAIFFLGVPAALAAMAAFLPNDSVAALVMRIVGGFIGLLAVVQLALLRGTAGENRFGADSTRLSPASRS